MSRHERFGADIPAPYFFMLSWRLTYFSLRADQDGRNPSGPPWTQEPPPLKFDWYLWLSTEFSPPSCPAAAKGSFTTFVFSRWSWSLTYSRVCVWSPAAAASGGVLQPVPDLSNTDFKQVCRRGPRTRVQRSGTRDQGPMTRDHGPGTRDQRLTTRDQGSGTRDHRPETMEQGPGTRDYRPETGDQGRPKIRDYRPETRDQRPTMFKSIDLKKRAFWDQGQGARVPARDQTVSELSSKVKFSEKRARRGPLHETMILVIIIVKDLFQWPYYEHWGKNFSGDMWTVPKLLLTQDIQKTNCVTMHNNKSQYSVITFWK